MCVCMYCISNVKSLISASETIPCLFMQFLFSFKCPFQCFFLRKSFEVCSSGVDCLLKVSTQLQDIELLFTPPDSQANQIGSQMALIRSLIYIQGEINSSVDDFAIWKTQLFSSISHCEGKNDSLSFFCSIKQGLY